MSTELQTPPSGLQGPFDISDEHYREYEFGGTIYRIDSPKQLFYRSGGSTHRIVDSNGVTHCVPAPGERGCVLRWFTPDNPVAF